MKFQTTKISLISSTNLSGKICCCNITGTEAQSEPNRTNFLNYFVQSRIFYPQLNLRQSVQSGLGSLFVIRSQLGPYIQLGSFPCAGLHGATQSTHLLKDCHSQMVQNLHRSKILSPKQLGYRCIPLQPEWIFCENS